MLRSIFLEVLYRSMVAGGVVVIILFLRLLLMRAPRVYSYLLWALVLYRLLCPFTFVSDFSFLRALAGEDTTRVQTAQENRPAAVQSEDVALEPQDLQSDGQLDGAWRDRRIFRITGLGMAVYAWLAGIVAMFLYAGASLALLSRRMKGAVRLRENIYLSDYVPTPFVIGVVCPRIYLPSSLGEKEMDYIILHERTHIRRGDHIIRIVSFFALAVYWFHPLIWAAYYLSGKDMEISCDEAVMRRMERDIRADYATSLLNLTTGKLFSGGIPLAFGEGDTKARIKNVMRWRRPRPIVVGIALAAVVLAAVVLGTDPKPSDSSARQAAAAENRELRQTADAWAKAFCDRDGNAIVNISTKQVQENLINEELLGGEEDSYGFGWSSPWPWDSGQDYRIVECAEENTVILYYAWTSDPHVTVWREHLTWKREGDAYRVDESAVDFLSGIFDGGSFEAAYGAGINGTPIDYLANGAGEALNENALQNREDYQEYRDLFAPETAARVLLNLSSEEKDVTVTAGSRQDDGSVEVTVFFPTDGGSAVVKMVQPYGAEGIWVVQDAEY